MDIDTGDFAKMTGGQIRDLCRRGLFDRPTAGVALGFTQANLVVLHLDDARDFEIFCQLNPKPCPLLAVTGPGQYELTDLALGADVRTDLPRYRVHRSGECVETPTSIEKYWDDECVAFLIGCSFTFESALIKAGLPVRHIEERRNVSMYKTNIDCEPAGRFAGPLVVSMRPMTAEQAQQAAGITESFPRVHGAPIQIGDAAALGIGDLTRPDYGDAVTIHADEIPVFWACGVTPMAAVMQAKPEFAITHEPGHMFVTDVLDDTLEELF